MPAHVPFVQSSGKLQPTAGSHASPTFCDDVVSFTQVPDWGPPAPESASILQYVGEAHSLSPPGMFWVQV
jgi:hypothetical protein